MKKIFKPPYKPAKHPDNEFVINKRHSKSIRHGEDYFPLIIVLLFAGFILIGIIVISNMSNKKGREVHSKSEKVIKSNSPQLKNASERILPEGKIGKWAKSVVYLEAGYVEGNLFYAKKMGSGFLVKPEKTILTNYHVVEGEEYFVVTFYDGVRVNVNVQQYNIDLDIVVLSCDNVESYPQLEISNDNDVKIGRRILVMGFPLASSLGSEMTLTDGLISSIRKEENGDLKWYQINASINTGNSGGPLLDAENGKVLGIVTAKIESAENIGLARPIILLKEDHLIEK